VQFGDGDGLELTAYQHMEGLLPVRIPRHYFGDISRASSFYLLVTECVPYGPRGDTSKGFQLDWKAFEPGELLPKSGKYQDDRIIDSHLYYYALLRAMARMAAADKRGAFDEIFGPSVAWWRDTSGVAHGGMGGGVVAADTRSRRAALKARAVSLMDVLVDFGANWAPKLFASFSAPLGIRATLERIRDEFIQMAPYFAAAQKYIASKSELVACSHTNLQIDNAFFWRTDDETDPSKAQLECGLLDWYGVARTPTVGVWMGSLSGVEVDVLLQHEMGLMECYSAEYHKYGGPLIDPLELQLQFRLSFVSTFLGNLQYIDNEVKVEGPPQAEFLTIADRWDPRIMGVWNVRCRIIGILQLLSFYEAANLRETFMQWVGENPQLCKEPER